MWHQQTLTLGPKSRGFHLVTDEILGQIRELSRVKTGLLHLLLQHTSASLTLNENCDPTVRYDMEQHFLTAVPDNAPYEHDYEGPDDNRPAVSLKTSPELAELLRQQHRDVRPSKHLNKAHWSTVFLDGSLPDSQIYYLVDASYQQALDSLTENKRKLLS